MSSASLSSSNEAISTNGASSIDACLLSHLFLSVIPIFAAPRAGVSILQPWCHGYQRIAMVGVLWNLWSWEIKTDRISGYLAKRAMKNFAAGRNDNRFIYSVSPKTREREDWTARTNVIERTAN